jgi:HD superfamily phosphodiesterase
MKCPGQDQRYWKPDDIFEEKCPKCGNSIEFWKDEPRLKCPVCKEEVLNPKIDLGCAEWCQYAEQCLGVVLDKNDNILCDKLIAEMKEVFQGDTRRIEHALAVLDYAEQIQAAEGGDPLVVKAAGILHDIGILEAERKHGSSAGKYQEMEGPAIAEPILKKFEIDAEKIEHILKIISNHHSDKELDTTEFRVVWDADRIVNLDEEHGDLDKEKFERIVERVFKTDKGKELARLLVISTETK